MELHSRSFQRWLTFVVLMTLALVASCTAPAAPMITPSTTLPSNTPFASMTPLLPTVTYTFTLSPVSPTATASPTVVALPTLTPAPTFTPNERQALVQEMLKTNGGCDLPCWWGIVPGQTDWQTAKGRFIAYGGSVFDVTRSTLPFEYRISHSFVQRDGVVESIQVMVEVHGGITPDQFATDWKRYSLDRVLTRYGVPAQVWLFLEPSTEPGSSSNYGLTVAYGDLGVLIYYEGAATISETRTQACPRMQNVVLMLFQLQQPNTTASNNQPAFPSGKPFVHTLEEATGMSLDTFYKTFKSDNNQTCLDLPTTWP